MQKLDDTVSQIQTNILLQYAQALPSPDKKVIITYIQTLRIINQVFEEHYELDALKYQRLAKEPGFVSRLPLRNFGE